MFLWHEEMFYSNIFYHTRIHNALQLNPSSLVVTQDVCALSSSSSPATAGKDIQFLSPYRLQVRNIPSDP